MIPRLLKRSVGWTRLASCSFLALSIVLLPSDSVSTCCLQSRTPLQQLESCPVVF
jgi:hypothetical protein